jgi:hypothetical protein
MNESKTLAFSRDNSFFQEKSYPVYGQPELVSNAPSSIAIHSEIPIEMTCQFCNTLMETQVQRKSGLITWVTSLALSPCCLCALPWMLGPTFREPIHLCPKCHHRQREEH